MNLELPGLVGKIVASISPVALPEYMPFVPICLRRHILTIIQAEELDEYPTNYSDDKLKRWFLILEELETQTEKTTPQFKNIKCIRDFVSHRVCDRQAVLTFLKQELPSAVYINSNGKEEARFLRDDQLHMSLVSNYETIARNWAKDLVKQEVIRLGGSI